MRPGTSRPRPWDSAPRGETGPGARSRIRRTRATADFRGTFGARNPGNVGLTYPADPSDNEATVSGRVFGPYIELKDEDLLAAVRPDGTIAARGIPTTTSCPRSSSTTGANPSATTGVDTSPGTPRPTRRAWGSRTSSPAAVGVRGGGERGRGGGRDRRFGDDAAAPGGRIRVPQRGGGSSGRGGPPRGPDRIQP